MSCWPSSLSKNVSLAAFLVLAAISTRGEGPPSARKPVLVELFTSEGCSSCPPADIALAHLATTQPVAGAEIVALALHVDYWNRLGWADPFSSPAFSARQSDYGRVRGGNRVYTPQVVVDGRKELVGSDEKEARHAVEEAARLPKASIEILQAVHGENAELRLRVSALPPVTPGDTAELLLAVTEDRLATDVPRGENAGRRLVHNAVVRELAVVGAVEPGAPFETRRPLRLKANWKRNALHAVAFVQERKSRKVLGVARISIQGEGTVASGPRA
ncbi:MAG TPA: DUF1223 domain-containing protein [Thermoanaerobaculia bacterium]|jgi:hypothetical protein|nr:DUF1223 domain-containing protein [Thermoanaerobaculia bacterium]